MLAGVHQRCERLTAVWALDEMFFEVHDQDILPDLAQNKRRADVKPCAGKKRPGNHKCQMLITTPGQRTRTHYIDVLTPLYQN